MPSYVLDAKAAVGAEVTAAVCPCFRWFKSANNGIGTRLSRDGVRTPTCVAVARMSFLCSTTSYSCSYSPRYQLSKY